jgi:hypothetical protein
MVALRHPFPKFAPIAVFSISGFCLGWDSATEIAPIGTVFKILIGTWIGLALLILNLVNYAAMCPKKPWIKIGFRVLGSWIIAISSLALALALRR